MPPTWRARAPDRNRTATLFASLLLLRPSPLLRLRPSNTRSTTAAILPRPPRPAQPAERSVTGAYCVFRIAYPTRSKANPSLSDTQYEIRNTQYALDLRPFRFDGSQRCRAHRDRLGQQQ